MCEYQEHFAQVNQQNNSLFLLKTIQYCPYFPLPMTLRAAAFILDLEAWE